MFHSLSDFIGQRLNVTIIQNILALFSAELINAPLINEDDQVMSGEQGHNYKPSWCETESEV